MSRTAVPTARPGRLCLRLELRDPTSSRRRCPVPVKRGFGGMRKRPPACHWLLFPGQPAVIGGHGAARDRPGTPGTTVHSVATIPATILYPRLGAPAYLRISPGSWWGHVHPSCHSCTCGTLRRRPSIGQADRTLVNSNIVESKIRLQQK